MGEDQEPPKDVADPAAVFGAALSLWHACQRMSGEGLNLSECFNGMDQFMREVMRVATTFEVWACQHIAFEELSDVWPYLLQDHFGAACLAVISPNALGEFGDADCLRVAVRLRLPVKLNDQLPIPFRARASNPVAYSGFREFHIQTIRDSIEESIPTPFIPDQDPYDDEFGPHYFALYGVAADGRLEHVADRKTYSEIVSLVQKLAPGVTFPLAPTFDIQSWT
jgi:hypothetical protein